MLRSLFAFALAALAGCAGADPSSAPLSTAITAPDESPVLAMVRDGDAIYAARTTSLERIDARTGEASRVAGAAWADCPAQPGAPWGMPATGIPEDTIDARGGRVLLAAAGCGVWSFEVATGAKRMLVDPAVASPAGMALVADGAGLIACARRSGEGGSGIAVWHVGADGAAGERLAFVPDAIGNVRCGALFANETSVHFAVGQALYRHDRATRALSMVRHTPHAAGFHGAVFDGDGAVVLEADALVRIDPDPDPEPPDVPRVTTLLPARSRSTVRTRLRFHAPYLYFYEDGALRRVQTRGSAVLLAAEPTADGWIDLGPLAFGDTHVFFQRGVQAPASASGTKIAYTIHRAPL